MLEKGNVSLSHIIGDHVLAWMTLLMMVISAAILAWAALFASNNMPENVGHPLALEEQSEIIARNSSLASFVYLSPNATFPRTDDIKKITIHHMADNDISLERLGETFAQRDRKASSNYAIDKEGNIAIYVEEANRAWTSSNPDNDQQAITIEVENSEIGGEWPITDASYNALINLCVDICRRNGIEALVFTGDSTGNLTYHQMFSNDTVCPGPYLANRMSSIASEVNEILEGETKL